jgi:thiopeptide-type bacteriocin biosynthesis protein
VADTSRGKGIVPSGFFVFRTPLLPFEELAAWGEGLAAGTALEERLPDALAADRETLRSRLRDLCARPEIREALFLASPSLSEGLELWQAQPDSKKGLRAERALVRYFFRMTARATPFGLFSGCSLGPVDPQPAAPTRLALGPRSAYERHTRLDMDYLFALCEDLGKDPALRRELLYRPNSSLYEAAGRLRYAEARLVRKVRSHHLVAVERTDYLDATLAAAAQGARIADLVGRLVASDPDGEITEEDAEGYVHELIDSQILVSDLSPPVTGPEAMHDLVDQLRRLPTDAGERLARARDALAALDAAGPGAPPERYREIAADLESLPTPVEMNRLFQLDMVKPADQPVLGGAVLAEIERGFEILRRMSSRRADLLDKFRKDFSERYGEGREVPLVEVLDEEIGIGFEKSGDAGAEASPLLQGLALGAPVPDNNVAWGPRETFLLARLSEALASGAQAIELTKEDLEQLTPPPPAGTGPDAELPPLADAFQLMATVAAASQEALAAGDFRVLHGGAVGPSGARLLGRFCHADPELTRCVEAHLRAEEAFAPEAVFAEIVHLPQGRIGNILSRPVLREHEIPFLGRSGAPPDQQIPVTDLTVTVTGQHILLRSRRLGREVIPRLTSAHNYRRGSLGLYRFLCILQSQELQGGVGWSWGPLDNAPFLPRVTTGRLVLARAAWWMTGDEIKQLVQAKEGAERFAAVRAWRDRRRIPRWISLADGDNELLVDFDNTLSVDTFLDVVEGRDRARLLEPFPGPEQLCATGPEGHFVHEMVIPYVMAPKETAARPETPETPEITARRRPAPAPPHGIIRRTFPPGSEWLYVKLYTGTATADVLLREVVAPVVAEALGSGVADSWFFIRYSDPDWHLRVRFHGDPRELHARVLPALGDAAAPLLDDRRLWKLQLDTYEREVERYGGPEGIALAERLFSADSEAILGLIDLLEGDEGADVRWRLGLVGIDRLLTDLGLDDAAKAATLERLRGSFWREFKGDKNLRVQLDQRMRGERRSLGLLLAGDAETVAPLAPALALFDKRSRDLAPVVAEMAKLEAEGRLAPPLREIAPSFVHMHVNRLIRSAARAHEMVLYDFLHQLYASREARQRKGGTGRA